MKKEYDFSRAKKSPYTKSVKRTKVEKTEKRAKEPEKWRPKHHFVDFMLNPRTLEEEMKVQLRSDVRFAAQRKGLTLEEIARRCGLSPETVREIILGRGADATIEQILKLVEAVDLVAEVQVREAD